MVQETARAFFEVTGATPFQVHVEVRGDVPIARGLGSSVTVRLGVAAGLNRLAQTRLARTDLLDLVAVLEHHPDNAAPAVLGGFTAAGVVAGSVRALRVPVWDRLRFVALIPEFEVSTDRARKLVPNRFSKADTVHSLNRSALVTAAFASGRYDLLPGLFDDRVHQPYRQKLIPPLFETIAAGEAAGALGGWLSGSGSTIMCLASDVSAQAVGRAMKRVLPRSKVAALPADNRGFRVIA
jgi:homoserine kinase